MIKQNFLLLVYNKDVICIKDKDKEPICTTSPRISRRADRNQLPSHDPYIPRNSSLLFNCSIECHLVLAYSLTQLVSPHQHLKSCFMVKSDSYNECESIRYHYFKNSDKVLFLSNIIRDKTFYVVDCLVYSDGERVCHRKNNADSYAELIDTGALTRPHEPSVLSQDEFICEESVNREINCDLSQYIPFDGGLQIKETVTLGNNVLLKSGTYIVILNHTCIGSWCGYSGRAQLTRRQYSYRPPGGKTYRCYYAKKQQICKELYTPEKTLYNNRGWL